jgi:capsular polysaccharide biosynthesis protein
MAMLDEAKELLAAVGVRLAMVSVDEDSTVLVSEPDGDQVSVQVACELSRRALTQVARTVRGSQTELVELRCGRRSEWPCTFSLQWAHHKEAISTSASVPSLEMLIAGRDDEPASLTTGSATGSKAATATATATKTSKPIEMVESSETKTIVHRPADPEDPNPEPEVAVEHQPRWANVGAALPQLWRKVPRPRHVHSPQWLQVPPWLQRRWWLLLLCGLAGIGGGFVARSVQSPIYSASSEIVVATGAGEQGPGDANDAVALALTDASIIPSDQSLLHSVSRQIHTPAPDVADRLSAAVEAGTSVVIVTYQDASPTQAIRGANAVARTVTSVNEESSSIPNGSLALVQLATQANSAGMLRTYGIPLGCLFGLLIGFIFILAIERADPRADDVEDLAEASGTPASAYPGPVSLGELEQLIGRASTGALSATLVPLTVAELPLAIDLRDELELHAHNQSLAFDVMGPLGTQGSELTSDAGPTVLVVEVQAKLRTVKSVVERLELLGRAPVWSVLVTAEQMADTQ